MSRIFQDFMLLFAICTSIYIHRTVLPRVRSLLKHTPGHGNVLRLRAQVPVFVCSGSSETHSCSTLDEACGAIWRCHVSIGKLSFDVKHVNVLNALV